VGAILNLPVDEAPEGLFIDGAIFEGGHQSGEGTLEAIGSHDKPLKPVSGGGSHS
jgi:hypothetical protein